VIQALNLPEDFAERLELSVRESFKLRWKAAQQAAADDF
jgi:hypothetical protein